MTYNSQINKYIPENWKINSVANNSLSEILKPGVECFQHKRYLATADIKGTSILQGTLSDFENRESRANMQPTVYSVWFAKMKNSVKHLFLNPEMKSLIDESILSTGFCGLQCNENTFEYIASFIGSPYFETHKDILSHGATQEAVNNEDLLGIKIIIPDEQTLSKYHNVANPLYSQISQNNCEKTTNKNHLTRQKQFAVFT